MIHTAVKARTATHEVIDIQLKAAGKPPLAALVRKARKAGTSWRVIAEELRPHIDRDVNWQTIRNWFPTVD